jgi:TRAP transporter TAXI family solute receptor
MTKRHSGLLQIAALLGSLLVSFWVCLASAQTPVARTAFVIATGPTGGTYFPIGEAIAAIISHPPGVYRCERRSVCGPPGLIASVRTSPGAVANVLAVNAHHADAALAQSDVVADAVAGKGAFRREHPQTHVRLLADLFPEEVHVIAAANAHIRSISDLRGRRVSIGPPASGTAVTARALLAAYGITPRRIKVNADSADAAAEKLAKGQLDAMIFVGGAPVPFIRELLEDGKAALVPVAGPGRSRLLKRSSALSPATIPADIYPHTGKIDTVAVKALFIVSDSIPDATVYAIAKSLFNPANRGALAGSHRSAQAIRLQGAAAISPAPLHPGARRFYVEAGVLPKTAGRAVHK